MAATTKHMGVAEVKRHFADVIGEVMHTKRRIIIERRGRPVAVLSPVEEEDKLAPSQRLAALIGFGGEEGDRFYEKMPDLLRELRRDMPRELPEIDL